MIDILGLQMTLEQLITSIVALVSLIGSLTGFVFSLSVKTRSKVLEQALKDAKERETYAICPKCAARIPLSELEFHLPSGAVDQNLNGVADVDEK